MPPQFLHSEHPSPSAETSKQQNFWDNHQPVVQYPIFRSDSQTVMIDIRAALSPMPTPVYQDRASRRLNELTD
jgi:hypothetical protein